MGAESTKSDSVNQSDDFDFEAKLDPRFRYLPIVFVTLWLQNTPHGNNRWDDGNQ